LHHARTFEPAAFDVATDDVRLAGAIVECDAASGKAISIERWNVAGEGFIIVEQELILPESLTGKLETCPTIFWQVGNLPHVRPARPTCARPTRRSGIRVGFRTAKAFAGGVSLRYIRASRSSR
jgi:hypothetical protein